ncbi:recombinase family protein [Methylocella sp.]|uniref:recombinase family protein n=1 Tax=Methylocella sp. TaxID=1978226 RepID=UPI0035AE824B
MRAAIYARFSSELQSERSVDDQVALCRAFALKSGLEVVAVYDDRARSGASIFGRDGLMRMMDAARDRAFDVLIVEALDRLSRDQEDLAGIWKRLKFLGVDVLAVHDGKADQIQIGIRGLVGALYLQDLAHKVRRGLSGVVRGGKHPGGRAYGYRAVPGKPGELEIVAAEAEIIREIFAAYVGGRTPREIAASLNGRKVPPPRGGHWMASTINGSLARHNGLILNELYAGRIVWNKVRMIKNPDTGKRVSRPNPPSEWQAIDAPHLRIVDQDIYEKAVATKLERGGPKPHQKRTPRRPLSGLLRCGHCGAGMSMKDRRNNRVRIQCTQMKEGGACDHRRAYDLETVERTVFDGLKANLTDPALIAEYVRTYNDERKRLAASLNVSRARIERRIGQVTREIDRLIDSYAKGFSEDEEMKLRLPPLRAERQKLESDLACAEKPPEMVSLHPAAILRYRQQVENLNQALSAETLGDDQEPVRALRELVAAIIVHPTQTGERLNIEVRGRLAALIGHDVFPQARMWGGTLVAEEGLEPPTQGL